MFDAIIVMAGEGKRTGLEVNKVLYPLLGIELFIYSVKAFLQNLELNQLILVINPNDEVLVKEILAKYNFIDKMKIVLAFGGKTRAESVRNGLRMTTSGKILIHDAARPLLSNNDINQVLEALDHYEAVTLVNPIYDTVKVVQNKIVETTLRRDILKKVITPQGIRRSIIKKILNPDLPDDQITDEMILLEQDYEVYTIETMELSIKFTTKEDGALLEYYLRMREEK